ncbi:MAG: divalent-cation tolerance protein CutA [Chlamydiae bacterium]|nr:divalent-cation tolerance protein CutA [Chlamydiota bacterium]
MICVLWTCKHQEEAKKICRNLLDARLIACASLLPEVFSLYRWEGTLQESQECKVFLKTTEENFPALCKRIQEECSYEVPEILQISIAAGNPSYLAWVKESVQDS